jgi:hypothetical protein
MSGWSSTRATRKRRTRSWPKERVTTTRSPATPPLLVAFHPPWAVIYLTDKVAREVAECSPTPLSKPDLCYSHHAARWLPRAASTMSRQSTVPRSVNKTSFIRRYLCWRGERPQARRTGPVVSTTASRSVTNVSNESLRPRGQRFARDSPLEGDGFELPVPRELGLRRGRRLALYLGSLTLRRRGPDWNATKRRRDSERRASTAAERGYRGDG